MEQKKKQDVRASPFMPMFEAFREEIDEHHDRRERIIKASRDITAISKKMSVRSVFQSIEPKLILSSIFALQRYGLWSLPSHVLCLLLI